MLVYHRPRLPPPAIRYHLDAAPHCLPGPQNGTPETAPGVDRDRADVL